MAGTRLVRRCLSTAVVLAALIAWPPRSAGSVVLEDNLPPLADFTISPPVPTARDIVTLTDVSTDDDGIASRSWSIDSSGDPVIRFKVCETLDVTLSVYDGLEGLDLDGYHLFHAIRADLLRRVGRKDEAALAYAAAIARTDNARERDFLQRSRQALTRA